MQYVQLGSADIQVSTLCLGTMTWGKQNTQQDADAQLQLALDAGINFIDTAEMYAVPPSADTYGKTEAIIGNWLARHREHRKNLIIASKIAGPGMSWVRAGGKITPEAIFQSVDASLARLNTDYIDLYQLHWPNRPHPHFGNHWPNKLAFTEVDANQQREEMLSVLHALQHCIEQGKIRYCGLSNESPWGIATYLQLSQQHAVPRMVSIQNEFNLLHHKDWPYLIEQCWHEQVAYLPWSPLASGVLSGKYLNGQRPTGSRWTITQRHGLFRDTESVHQMVQELVTLAQRWHISAAQLALAWVRQVPGVTSSIIGATSVAQLQDNLASLNVTLDAGQLAEIDNLIRQFPQPF